MTGRGRIGRWKVAKVLGSSGSMAVDGDENDRLLRELGLELSDMEENASRDDLPPALDDWDELGDWE